MANLSLKDVPDELMKECHIEALVSDQTFRDWVLSALVHSVSQQQEDGPTAARLGGARRASPRTRSSSLGLPRARKQASTKPRDTAVPPADKPVEEQTRCPHGLTWHPGCNA
jgi:hypothetical protein